MLRRRPELVGMAVGSTVLAAAGARARHGVTDAEATVFRWVNDLPDAAYRAVWVPMQYGTLGTVPVLMVLPLAWLRQRLAAALAVAGGAAWVLAKAVKPEVGRGRPASALAAVHVRGNEEGDLGFPSGHAAVSAALTVSAWWHLSGRSRLLASTLAAFVPFARMYVGAHLPLDVVGGSALGLAIGSAVNLALG
jgi:membrane-associated phospholipid phosphatase